MKKFALVFVMVFAAALTVSALELTTTAKAANTAVEKGKVIGKAAVAEGKAAAVSAVVAGNVAGNTVQEKGKEVAKIAGKAAASAAVAKGKEMIGGTAASVTAAAESLTTTAAVIENAAGTSFMSKLKDKFKGWFSKK